MSKVKSNIPDEKLALYDALIATHPNAERKGARFLYTSVNGHMYSYLDQDGVLGLRLPKDAQQAFLDTYESGPFIQYGSVMKDYVTVPSDLFEATDDLKPFLAMSFDYVSGLKPKPTRKKPNK